MKCLCSFSVRYINVFRYILKNEVLELGYSLERGSREMVVEGGNVTESTQWLTHGILYYNLYRSEKKDVFMCCASDRVIKETCGNMVKLKRNT